MEWFRLAEHSADLSPTPCSRQGWLQSQSDCARDLPSSALKISRGRNLATGLSVPPRGISSSFCGTDTCRTPILSCRKAESLLSQKFSSSSCNQRRKIQVLVEFLSFKDERLRPPLVWIISGKVCLSPLNLGRAQMSPSDLIPKCSAAIVTWNEPQPKYKVIQGDGNSEFIYYCVMSWPWKTKKKAPQNTDQVVSLIFLWWRTTSLSNRTLKAASFVIWLRIKNQGDLSSWKMALDFNNVSWYLNSESLMWSALITSGMKKQTISVSLEERNAFQIRYCEKIHLCFKWKGKNSGRKK